jgi:hypothetical protein
VAEAGIPNDIIPHSDTRAVLKYYNHTVRKAVPHPQLFGTLVSCVRPCHLL